MLFAFLKGHYPMFIFLIISIVFGFRCLSFNIFKTSPSPIISNALVKSIKHTKAGLLYSIDFFDICLKMNIASVVDLFCRNPCCSSLMPVCRIFSVWIFVNSFEDALNKLIPIVLWVHTFSFFKN